MSAADLMDQAIRKVVDVLFAEGAGDARYAEIESYAFVVWASPADYGLPPETSDLKLSELASCVQDELEEIGNAGRPHQIEFDGEPMEGGAVSAHTPGPWLLKDDFVLRVPLATCWREEAWGGAGATDESRANAARIVACINALEGIADPQAFVAAAKAAGVVARTRASASRSLDDPRLTNDRILACVNAMDGLDPVRARFCAQQYDECANSLNRALAAVRTAAKSADAAALEADALRAQRDELAKALSRVLDGYSPEEIAEQPVLKAASEVLAKVQP